MSSKALPALAARTQAVDDTVVRGVRDFLEPLVRKPFAIVATGGYGRRELFPFSDIDFVLLFEDEPDSAALKEPLGELLRFLWDSALKVSHSVRTVAECCRLNEQNTELHISLLDARFVCGDESLFQSGAARLADFYRGSAMKLAMRLADMVRARHTKFEGTVYHLEPNVKEGPGGVRDVHFLHWAAQLAPQKEPLVEAATEARGVAAFLYDVRYFLHVESGRDNNVISFELQDRAAAVLPTRATTPEEWMREYYRHARRAFQSSLQALEFLSLADTSLVRQFLDRRGRLSTGDFTVAHDRIFLRNPAQALGSFLSIFELFIFVARQGVPLSWDAQRRVSERLRSFGDAQGETVLAWASWRELLGQPHVALAIREMQLCGILPVVFPVWHAIDSLVVRDFYHRYTVDEHTTVALATVDDLLIRKDETAARFRELAREDDNLPILRMALLLHDVGKGTTPGEHVRGSLLAADDFLRSISVPEAEREQIGFLVEHHLDLSVAMNGRDLEDPATGRALAAQALTAENLRRLTLLTFADISAVNPTAMNPWRAEQLWRAYSVAAAQLTRELVSDRIHQTAKAPVTTLARPELTLFLEGFPTRYLRIHSREQIERHFALEKERQKNGCAVKLHHEPGAFVMTALARDKPGVFASLCGALASFGMTILRAEAASNASGCVLDEFRFADPNHTLELNPDELPRLQWTAECALRGAIDVRELLKRRRANPRPRSLSQLVPSVHFDDAASELSTLVYFTAYDRPGLLFDLASALTEAGCNIEVVLVNTEAHKAIDVLYLTKDGAKLDGQTRETLRQRLLAVAGATI